jgi:hypothetical protein
LFTHLIERDPVVHLNPARDVDRPNINRKEGSTPAFSPEQARKVLDAPDPETIAGLRDRAILSVGLQGGPGVEAPSMTCGQPFGHDDDADIDLADFAAFSAAFTGIR